MTQKLFQGLTSAEAAQRRQQGQVNLLPKNKDGGVLSILRKNILTLFNAINLLLALLLIWVESYRNLLFMGVVFSNILIGVVQELRAKRTLDRLKLLSASHIRTLRDGQVQELLPEELVLDDVVLLRRGEQIPADAEVLDGNAQADESLLTGESVPVAKYPGDSLYSGSFLVGGSVTARLTAVGASSYAGRLQLDARRVKRARSALMHDMHRIIRWVSLIIIPVGLITYFRQTSALNQPFDSAVTGTVAAMLGMIPEGLILLTSVSLAAGVVKLGSRNALVNELYGIETLARTDVVCMDKTGTLTNGEMTLVQTVALEGTDEAALPAMLSALVSTFDDPTPTNRALLAAFPADESHAMLAFTPFSSERKWSAAQFESFGTLVLGAPERLLSGEALRRAGEYAAEGLRVLAFVQTEEPLCSDTLPGGLHPAALLCLRDTLRPNVQKTIRYFGEQGVSLKVISGDSPLTVSCTAAAAGVPDADRMIDLSAVKGEKDYAALAEDYAVFGRVSPDDKRGLIEALRSKGHGVAMIGDGVNDIPALKAADCSIAMAGGSDAASRVAQITLLNADFDIMPEIVLEGRRVINNITRASSLFLVKNVFSLILTVFLLVLPFAYPFAPIQLTLVSSLTIGVPSFVLALQPSRERVQGNFLQNVIRRALPGGICTAVLTLLLMLLSIPLQLTDAQLSTLATLMAGYSGLVVLLLTCLPLNALRSALVTAMTAAFVLAAGFLPGLFYLVPVSGAQWWLLAAAGVLAPLIQTFLASLLPRHARQTAGSNHTFAA